MTSDSRDFAVLAARVRTEIDRCGLKTLLSVTVLEDGRPILRLSWVGAGGHPEALDVPADAAWTQSLCSVVRRFGRGLRKAADRYVLT